MCTVRIWSAFRLHTKAIGSSIWWPMLLCSWFSVFQQWWYLYLTWKFLWTQKFMPTSIRFTRTIKPQLACIYSQNHMINEKNRIFVIRFCSFFPADRRRPCTEIHHMYRKKLTRKWPGNIGGVSGIGCFASLYWIRYQGNCFRSPVPSCVLANKHWFLPPRKKNSWSLFRQAGRFLPRLINCVDTIAFYCTDDNRNRFTLVL